MKFLQSSKVKISAAVCDAGSHPCFVSNWWWLIKAGNPAKQFLRPGTGLTNNNRRRPAKYRLIPPYTDKPVVVPNISLQLPATDSWLLITVLCILWMAAGRQLISRDIYRRRCWIAGIAEENGMLHRSTCWLPQTQALPWENIIKATDIGLSQPCVNFAVLNQ